MSSLVQAHLHVLFIENSLAKDEIASMIPSWLHGAFVHRHQDSVWENLHRSANASQIATRHKLCAAVNGRKPAMRVSEQVPPHSIYAVAVMCLNGRSASLAGSPRDILGSVKKIGAASLCRNHTSTCGHKESGRASLPENNRCSKDGCCLHPGRLQPGCPHPARMANSHCPRPGQGPHRWIQ